MKLKYILCGFVVFALLAGCAKPPTAEMDNARNKYLEASENEAAATYGKGFLDQAKTILDKMEAANNDKRFDAAKTHAAEVITAAQKAIDEGKKTRENVKSKAENLITTLEREIKETEANITNISKIPYPYDKLDLTRIKRDFDDAKDMLALAETDQSKGKYQDALDKGNSVKSTLASINQQIADAVPRKKS